MLDINLLKVLVDVLSEAEIGGRELDVRISVGLGAHESESTKLLKLFLDEGYDWQIVSALLDTQVPAYSTSLDASLPGEHIVGVLYSEKRGRWAAVHRGSNGREGDPLWANTEVLARRAAALTGLIAEHRGDAAAPAGPDEADESGPDRETGEDDAPEWKILF